MSLLNRVQYKRLQNSTSLSCTAFVFLLLQAYIPLVTVLLAISEQQFFLNHWNNFLMQIIMHNIKASSS